MELHSSFKKTCLFLVVFRLIITKIHVHLFLRSGKRCEGEEQGVEKGERRRRRRKERGKTSK